MPTRLPERPVTLATPPSGACPPRLGGPAQTDPATEARADMLAVAAALLAGLMVAIAVLWRSLV